MAIAFKTDRRRSILYHKGMKDSDQDKIVWPNPLKLEKLNFIVPTPHSAPLVSLHLTPLYTEYLSAVSLFNHSMYHYPFSAAV